MSNLEAVNRLFRSLVAADLARALHFLEPAACSFRPIRVPGEAAEPCISRALGKLA